MAPLIVVSGPPGAGKSTVARLLAAHFERSALVAGDEFFGFVVSGYVEPWLPGSHQQNQVVICAAASAAGRFAQGGFTVIYDGVLGGWFLRDFIGEAGVSVIHYVTLMPGQDACLERVGARTGHSFSDEDATGHMYRQFEAWPLEMRHVIRNLGSAEETANEVLKRFDEGQLQWKDSSTAPPTEK